MDRTTLYRALKPIEQRGWIALSDGEGRAKLASLTKDGRKALKNATKAWQAAEARLLGGVGMQDWAGSKPPWPDLWQSPRRQRHEPPAARTGPGSPRLHIMLVVAVTFLALLVSAGLRATPGVLLLPLQLQFGWDRATISLGAAVGIFLYGLVGPFAAALMQTVGIRRTMLGGLGLMAAATFVSQWMSAPWQISCTWGVFSGIGSGAVASVLGAAVVNRWFRRARASLCYS